MAMTPMLQVENLRFHFATHALFHDFSASLPAGITWLRGANGKGKTTLQKLLAGALVPLAGRIRLEGVDCADDPLLYRSRTLYAGTDLPELPWLTVRELLDLHLALYPAGENGAVNAQLAAFGITDVLEQGLTTLSLGQHKKVQLALALALPLHLLLLDEPFNGLDTAAVAYLRTSLETRAAEGRQCIVLTSHVEPLVTLAATLDLD